MKKVLIITYHWPPSGGITVLRCLKLVKYLREFGWEPIVFTAKNASYQILDESNLKDVPANLEIHRVPLFEPTQLFKKISRRPVHKPLQNITQSSEKKRGLIDTLSIWVRGNFFIPDARASWIKPSLKYLEEYLKNNPVDAIFTDGPPHTNTVIGMRLSQKFGIPWLADFQDPWTQVDYYSKMLIGKRANRIHHQLEQEVFQTAAKITIASPTWKKDLEQIGARDVSVFYYGYDESDFSGYEPKTTSNFTFFHGGLLGNDRNPVSFFEALEEILEENPQLKSRVKIKLAGEVDYSVIESLKSTHLIELTELMGMIPRKQVFKEYEHASLLLLPINQAANAGGRIPGKLFEMLRSQKPIMVFGPSNGDVKKIVETKKLGKSFEYSEKKEIRQFLHQLMVENKLDDFEPQTSVIEFSNSELTKQIAHFLHEITA
ncbi:hypothetical protein [Fluviicola sp.]|uniref:hypothetical protein n=1 Tax=Fluviicola sp. TaxID=1917219 RepID=UPI0031D947A4